MLKDLLLAIKNSTIVIPEHTDPGSVEDCWKEVFEIIEGLQIEGVTIVEVGIDPNDWKPLLPPEPSLTAQDWNLILPPGTVSTVAPTLSGLFNCGVCGEEKCTDQDIIYICADCGSAPKETHE